MSKLKLKADKVTKGEVMQTSDIVSDFKELRDVLVTSVEDQDVLRKECEKYISDVNEKNAETSEKLEALLKNFKESNDNFAKIIINLAQRTAKLEKESKKMMMPWFIRIFMK